MTADEREVFWMLLLGAIAATTVLAVTIILSGCAATDKLVTSVRSAAKFAALVEPVLVVAYRAEQQVCLEGPKPEVCVAEVRKRWDAIVSSYSEARAAWCAIDEFATGDARCTK